jgi:hypothetical protein
MTMAHAQTEGCKTSVKARKHPERAVTHLATASLGLGVHGGIVLKRIAEDELWLLAS